MLENIRLAFQGVWSHKMRSMLTMLGIIIGIAAIITIVSTIKGTNEQIKENLIGAGNNVVTVQLNENGYPFDASWSGSACSTAAARPTACSLRTTSITAAFMAWMKTTLEPMATR